MALSIESKAKLNNGKEIPRLGLGVYLSKSGKETRQAINWAFEAGYRHVDTAAIYGNEASVGDAILESGLPREEIFVTTKLWNDDHGYDRALKAFDESLKKLRVDFVDLYLIHWPVASGRRDSWRALERIYSNGMAKSIGVSNYTERHIDELLKSSDVVPVLNQVEFHPYLYQKALKESCESKKIWIEAYTPLTRGERFDDPILQKIAKKYDKTVAQIMIRWSLQVGTIVIPKSVHKDRIFENADVFDFEIEAEDMASLNKLDEGYRVTWDPTTIP